MIGEELDIQLETERAKLDAFAEEVRLFFDRLSQEVEADFSRLVSRLTEQQQQILDAQGDALLEESAQSSLSLRVQDGLQGIAAGGADTQESILGRALQSALGTVASSSVRRGRVNPRIVLRRVAGVLGTGLGQELAEGLGFDSGDGIRHSRSQAALDHAITLQRSQRNR